MPQQILKFWFELKPEQWWKKDPQFDQMIREKFGDLHAQATKGELWQWRDTAEGRLAEIIILDQFSRNLFRDSAKAFACDGMALILSQEAIRNKVNLELTPIQRPFLYMPFMHSESKVIHELAVQLFSESDLKDNLAFELEHKKIIDQFGRYPHRNKVLNRESTPEEIEFLKTHSGF